MKEIESLLTQIESIQTDLQEDRYVIRRNQEDVAEIKNLLNTHIGQEEAEIKDIHAKINRMSENNEIITDYVNKMAVGAWFMGKIKIIFLWLAGVVSGAYAFYEWVKHLKST